MQFSLSMNSFDLYWQKYLSIATYFNFLYNETCMNKIKIQKQGSERIKITFPNYNYSYISKIKSPLDSLSIKEMTK